MTTQPRLLLKKQAASYCGVCLTIFDKACPVKPIKLLDRIPRWDRHALDAWINGLTKMTPTPKLDLVEMWNGRDSDTGARP